MDKVYFVPEADSFQINPEEARRLRRQYLPRVIKTIVKNRKWSIIDHFYDRKIDEKSILIRALGVSVRGNAQYVLNILNHDDRFKGYKIYVRTSKETHETVKEYIKQNHWKRTKALDKHYNCKMEQCKYFLTESFFPYSWIKKPGQVLIDTWHGTPLKKLGIVKNGDKAHLQAIQQKNFLCADYFLYPNKFTRDVMYDSYGIVSLMQAKALMLGYPRTGGLLQITDERKAEIRRQVAPNGEKVYAYMPTFRGYLSDEETIKREKDLLDHIDRSFTDQEILYVNLHHHIGQALDCSAYAHIRTFPPLIDSYEFLTATDALVSDYSSVFFDYLILGKQIVLYLEDYETYRQYQGLNMDIETLPFDKAYTPDELVEMLRRGKTYDDSRIREELCGYDSPDNAEKLCQIFAGDETGLVLEEHPHNTKKKVIFYTQCCREGRETSLLAEFSKQMDKETYDYWIGCDTEKVKSHLSSAYPMLHESAVITSDEKIKFSSIGGPVRKKYRSGKMDFDTAITYLAHEYALVPIQEYGYTKFDLFVIYDTPNPDMILALSLSGAEHKALFITDSMLEAVAGGDTILRDAIGFAADHCNVVAVSREDALEQAAGILSDRWKDRISVIDSVDGLNKLVESCC